MNNDEYNKIKKANITSFSLKRHPGGQVSLKEGGTFSLIDGTGNSRHFPATEGNLLRVLAAFGLHLSSSKELVRMHTDKYHAELDVISHVTAYYDISSKRLIDDIPQVMETVFAKDFGLDLGKCLTKTLDLVGPKGVENCERYIQDEPDVHAKREDLLRQRGILDNALATLDKSFK